MKSIKVLFIFIVLLGGIFFSKRLMRGVDGVGFTQVGSSSDHAEFGGIYISCPEELIINEAGKYILRLSISNGGKEVRFLKMDIEHNIEVLTEASPPSFGRWPYFWSDGKPSKDVYRRLEGSSDGRFYASCNYDFNLEWPKDFIEDYDYDTLSFMVNISGYDTSTSRDFEATQKITIKLRKKGSRNK